MSVNRDPRSENLLGELEEFSKGSAAITGRNNQLICIYVGVVGASVFLEHGYETRCRLAGMSGIYSDICLCFALSWFGIFENLHDSLL